MGAGPVEVPAGGDCLADSSRQRADERMSAVGEQLEHMLTGATVIVGVGNRGRGDDGAGPALIDSLRGRTRARLVEAEEVPESYLGEITAGEADTVLLVDAVDFGGRPGEVGLFSRGELRGQPTFSTHRVPLRLVMDGVPGGRDWGPRTAVGRAAAPCVPRPRAQRSGEQNGGDSC